MERRIRLVQPFVELRTPFMLDRAEIDAVDRGAPDADWDPVVDAARRAALAEDRLVFGGDPPRASAGSSRPRRTTRSTITHRVRPVPDLRGEGGRARCGAPASTGPTPSCSARAAGTGVIETTQHGGYPVLEQLRLIARGPVLWAPAVDGALVVSLRGDDFELMVGQDLSIGYLDHDAASGHAVPGGEPHLPRGRPGGGGRADYATRAARGSAPAGAETQFRRPYRAKRGRSARGERCCLAGGIVRR